MAEYILRLEIPVKIPIFMQKSQSLHSLKKYRFNLRLSQHPLRLLCPCVHLQQISLKIVKYKIKLTFSQYNLFQFDYVGMIQLSERFNLTKSTALFPVTIFLLHFFNCDDLLGWAYCFEYSAECAIAKGTSYFVFLHRGEMELFRLGLL